MSWQRTWLYGRLTTVAEMIAIVPADKVHAAGSLKASPAERPFVMYRIGAETSRMQDADKPFIGDVDVEIWVYDAPGSYERIEDYIDALRTALPGQVPSGVCVWQGTSTELADDEMKCSTKFASIKLVGGYA